MSGDSGDVMKDFKEKLINQAKYILILLTLVFSVLSVVSNVVQRNNLIDNLESSMLDTNRLISGEVGFFFTRYRQIVNLMAENETLVDYIREVQLAGDRTDHPSYEAVVEFLGDVEASDQAITNPWIGLNAINAFIIHDDEVNRQPIADDYDYTKRSWYEKMLISEEAVVISPFFVSTIDGRTVCSVFAPVMAEGNEQGAIEDNIGQIGIGLSLAGLQSHVKGYKVGEEGFALLIDGEGNYLAAPDGWSESGNVHDSDDGMVLITETMLSEAEGITMFSKAGVDYYVAYSPSGVEGITVVTLVPEAEINGQLRTTAVFGAIIILLSVVVIVTMVIVGRISKKSCAPNMMRYRLT